MTLHEIYYIKSPDRWGDKNMADFITDEWPNGIITVAGAEKKIPETFSRPWQAHVPDPKNVRCPFHREDERAGTLLTDADPEG